MTSDQPVPTILVPIAPALRARLFGEETWARLAGLGNVVAATPTYQVAHDVDLSGVEVVLSGWGTGMLSEALLDALPALRALVHTGGSVRGVVGPQVYQRGVMVSSQTAENAIPVAEYSLAVILLAGKGAFQAQRRYAQVRGYIDREAEFGSAGLYRRRVGIVGLSRISRKLIDLLAPFEVEVLVYSRHLDALEAAALGVRSCSLREVLSTAEVISLHSASLVATRHLIGAEELTWIQDGATLVNTARGDLIDQAALTAELATGRFDAVLDVADPDVTPATSPLWDMPNVILTPHFAGSVGRELERLGSAAVDDASVVLRGGVPDGLVTERQFESQA